MVISLERGADCLLVVQLMPLYPKTPSSLASFKSRLVLHFLVPAYPGCPGKRPLNGYSSSSSGSYICISVIWLFGAKLQATNRVPGPVDRGTATRYGG